ncbi:MAG: ribulose-phosphate 3-epimerase [Nitrospiraceae bacterium]|nr:ribulose-phosphate 3-epimerase [Nitrospiraceae bacterium]
MRTDGIVISPSLLASDFGALASELSKLEDAGVPWVHWDVMDGAFVPNITIGPGVIAACRKNRGLFFDVHLMIERPSNYIAEFIKAGADLVSIHAEADIHLERTVSEIERLGARPAVALNPHTPLSVVEYLLPQLYMVVIMSVNPGFGGQKFIPFTLKKVRQLKDMIEGQGTETLIEVDGGVTLENAASLADAGADVLVSGSAFFGFSSYKEGYERFMPVCKGRELRI